MITPQHYVIRGLRYIHPEVLDEACVQGKYVSGHFADAILFTSCICGISLLVMYQQEDVTQGLLLLALGLTVSMLYMYVVFKNLPTVMWTVPPDPGLTLETKNHADFCEVLLFRLHIPTDKVPFP